MTAVLTGRLLLWAGRQLLGAGVVLLGASLLLLTAVRAAPGRPGDRSALFVAATDEGFGRLTEEPPFFQEYGGWVAGILRGDFGRSAVLQRGRPVGELLAAGAVRSLGLGVTALAVSAAGALGLALAAHRWPRARSVRVVEGVAHGLSTVPVFLWAYLLVAGGNGLLIRGAEAGWWPLPGWFPLPSRDAWIPWAAAAGVLALGDGLLVDLYQRFRSEVDHAGHGEHLVGVRLLRLSVPCAMARGFLPGASSHLARRIAFALGSLVVLESALSWPGLGYLAWRAAAERDLPVLLGVALTLAAVVRGAVLLANAASHAADPRRRTSW